MVPPLLVTGRETGSVRRHQKNLAAKPSFTKAARGEAETYFCTKTKQQKRVACQKSTAIFLEGSFQLRLYFKQEKLKAVLDQPRTVQLNVRSNTRIVENVLLVAEQW